MSCYNILKWGFGNKILTSIHYHNLSGKIFQIRVKEVQLPCVQLAKDVLRKLKVFSWKSLKVKNFVKLGSHGTDSKFQIQQSPS